MKKLVLDTSILIDVERKHAPTIAALKRLYKNRSLPAITHITYAEFYYGVLKKNKAEFYIQQHLETYDVIQTSHEANRATAKIRLDLEKKGLRLDAADILIAAAVLAEDAILITRDEHFSRIAGLTVVLL